MNLRFRFEAIAELIHRYVSVFSFFWKNRKNMSGIVLHEDEAEFLPAALALQEKPASSTAKLTGRLLILIVIVTLMWSIFGHIDIIVNAKGKVIPSSYTKTIASVDVAAVRAIHVSEGQAVKAGDVLLELDKSATDAEHDKASNNAIVAKLEMLRAQALINAINVDGVPKLPSGSTLTDIPSDLYNAAQLQLQSEYLDFQSKLRRLNAAVKNYAEELPLARQRAEDYQALATTHDVTRHQWIEKEQQRIELEGQLKDAQNQRAALIAQTIKEAHDRLTEGHRNLEANSQDALRAASRSNLMNLTSPIDGTVQQLAVHTIGGVVPAAQALMLIVPKENQVEVLASVDNKDIGFIHEGQTVEVKINAFDYTKYGTVSGIVTYVARDAQDDRKRGLIYTIKVILNKSTMNIEGKNLALSAGMSVDVEIKTGQRRTIEYLLSPLVKHQREALHER